MTAMRELLNGLVPGLPEDALAAIVGRAEGMPLYAVETVRGLLADGRIERDGDALRAGRRPVEHHRARLAALAHRLAPGRARAGGPHAPPGRVGPRPGLLRRYARRRDRRRPTTWSRACATSCAASCSSRGRSALAGARPVSVRPVAHPRGRLRHAGRRDRRARHLAAARHYEGIGDDELAGALASHYLAAHEASEEGAEADAVAAQARLALTGAADRAAALGAHDAGRRLPRAGAGHHHRLRPSARRCSTARPARRPPRPARRRAVRRGGSRGLSRDRRRECGRGGHRAAGQGAHRRRRGRARDRGARGGGTGGGGARRRGRPGGDACATSRGPTCVSGDGERRSRPATAHWRSPSG